jgi:gp45 sliding clamp, C terminal
MKFNNRTIQILRNFASINQSLIFSPGNTLTTISPLGSIMARATVETTFDSEFAIYDLSQFLGALSLFNEPELTLSSHSLLIGDKAEAISYTFAEVSLITRPPEGSPQQPDMAVVFTLKNESLSRALKALSIISATAIAVVGDGTNIYLEALNTKDSSSSTYKSQVGSTDKSFRLIFLAENIKILPDDYNVSISTNGVAHFKGTDIEYWVAVEDSSTYNG